jgi:hypothetical protein
MTCPVCGNEDFVTTEYKAGDIVAPALECMACKAVVLDVEAGRTDEERESIKLAIAARASSRNLPAAERVPDQPMDRTGLRKKKAQ